MKTFHTFLVVIALVNYAVAQSDEIPSDDVLNEMLGGNNPPVLPDNTGNDNIDMIAPPTPPPALIPSTTEGPIIGEVVTKGPIRASAITTKAISALTNPAGKNMTVKELKKNKWIKKKIAKDPEQGLHEIFEHIFEEKKYDKNIRPEFQKKPVNVKVQVLVNSFGPIIETSMDYKMDIFLRSTWTDKRLAFAGDLFNITNLNLDPSMIYNIWRPDIFFANAKKADFHKVTRDNNMLQLFPDGSLKQSIRISLTLDCPMNLKFFPLDEQVCSVYLESFAFPTSDLIFDWKEVDGFILPDSQMSTAQVRIVDWDLGDCTKSYKDTGNFTCVVAKIHLKREIGYYMIGTFIPTILIVVLSWISFWINPLAAPARVALGITTVLTMTTKASSIRAGLPKVSYIKAIDVWMLGCLLFVFLALLQYAYVNFIIRLKRHYDFAFSTCADEKDPDKLEEIQKRNFSIAKRYDVICRVLFPVAFIIFNVTFWAYYLNTNSLDFRRCYENGGCIML